MPSLEDLPVELITHIIRYIDRHDALNLIVTNRAIARQLYNFVYGTKGQYCDEVLGIACSHGYLELARQAWSYGAQLGPVSRLYDFESYVRTALATGTRLDSRSEERGEHKESALFLARDHIELIRWLVAIGASLMDNEAYVFIRSMLDLQSHGENKGLEVLQFCLDRGSSELRRMIATNFRLHWVIREAPTDLEELLRLLLHHGCDPTDVGHDCTALSTALELGSRPLYRFLIKAGAKPNATPFRDYFTDHKSPLFLAIDDMMRTGNMDLLRFCFANGSRAQPWWKTSTIDLSMRNGVNAVTPLSYYLLTIQDWNMTPRPAQVVRFLFNRGAQLNPYHKGRGTRMGYRGWKPPDQTWMVDVLQREWCPLMRKNCNFIELMKFLRSGPSQRCSRKCRKQESNSRAVEDFGVKHDRADSPSSIVKLEMVMD